MGSEYEDLVHQGLLGLIDAVDRYDTSYGTRFSTFAAAHPRQNFGLYALLRLDARFRPPAVRAIQKTIQTCAGT
jgi:DNA-directed RNA polymerase sigma subunit (sigma70/sigma32)